MSAEYRLAPENLDPAALDDCHAAWTRLVADAETQRLLDERGARSAAQWLLCPLLDDRTAARRDLDSLRHHVWNNRLNRFGWRSYLAGESGSPQVPPYAVPARLRAAGVGAVLHVVRGAPHGCEAWAANTRPARPYLKTARAWLGEALAADA